jgi:hypothetical protein
MKKVIFATAFFAVLCTLFTTSSFAAKPRLHAAAGTKTVATGYSSAKLSRATNSVIVSFLNLSQVAKITYTLSYNANGVEQGAVGSITPSGGSENRDLYFGTCSHGVCTPHTHITGATLTVVTSLKNGKTNTKLYRIKI